MILALLIIFEMGVSHKSLKKEREKLRYIGEDENVIETFAL